MTVPLERLWNSALLYLLIAGITGWRSRFCRRRFRRAGGRRRKRLGAGFGAAFGFGIRLPCVHRAGHCADVCVDVVAVCRWRVHRNDLFDEPAWLGWCAAEALRVGEVDGATRIALNQPIPRFD